MSKYFSVAKKQNKTKQQNKKYFVHVAGCPCNKQSIEKDPTSFCSKSNAVKRGIFYLK